MNTIAVANQKGGVGKTTTVVNIAGTLAKNNNKILIIDLDPQGNCGQILDHNSKYTSKDIFTDSECKPVKTNIENIDIIPADRTLSDITHLLSSDIDSQFKIRDYLTSYTGYDYTIIDTPPMIGGFSTAGLIASDYVLIPISTNYLTIKGSNDLLNSISKVKNRLNPKLKFLGACITMHDKRTVLSNEILNETISTFRDKYFKSIINKTILIEEAQVNKKPVVFYQSKSNSAKEYFSLCNEIMEVIHGK
jgi:chromosome partitioning protein